VEAEYTAFWSPGQSLAKLCRIGGASLMLAGVLYVWAFAAEYILPPPGFGTTETLLGYVATYRPFFIASYVLFTVANSLSIVGALAIYATTRALDKSYAMLGAVALVIGFVVTLLSSTAPALLTLSAAYSATSSVVDQQALAIAAEAVTAGNDPLVAATFIGVGVIFVSLAMRSGRFGRSLVYLGLFVGAFNVFRALPVIYEYSLVTLLFVAVSSVWIFAVGRKIYGMA
jgi:hypothetical protein